MFKSKSNKVASKVSKQEPVFKQSYFNDHHRTYSCIHCRAHLANHDELISKLFQGNHGRAYLFNRVTNIGCKPAVQRELLTGLHAVADIYCDSCETTLGWKYEQAYVPSQKYKEGKYIIELVHMLKENEWDLTSYNTKQLLDEMESMDRVEAQANLRNGFLVGNGSVLEPGKIGTVDDRTLSRIYADRSVEKEQQNSKIPQVNHTTASIESHIDTTATVSATTSAVAGQQERPEQVINAEMGRVEPVSVMQQS